VTFGSQLPDVRVPPPGPRSRAMSVRLAEVESRNVTFSGEAWPIFWEEASGANVRDVDGNVYVDLTGAFGVALLGHRHPSILEAIDRQARRLLHGMGDIHPPAAKLELLERLVAITPWDDTRVVLSSTGSEAVEGALKTARLATGRPGILAFEGAYHGLTLGALATTERRHFRGPFAERLYAGVAFAPFPDPLRDRTPDGSEALERIAELLGRGAPNGDPIGTVIVEPVQARGGVRIAPQGFMAALSDLASEHDALVVADEIFTGLGRCGAPFASERVGLRPDIVCVGKALGGGLPLSACLAPRGVMDAWPPSSGEAIHTSTFLGHPLACAAAVASLDVIEHDRVAERAERLGAELVAGLADRAQALPGVAAVRGLGLLIGIELCAPGGGSPAPDAGTRVAEEALRRGLLLLPAGADGRVVELTPPVCLTRRQVEHAIDVLSSIIEDVA